MKKILFLLLPLIFQVSCGIYKPLTVDRLQLGMSRAEVEDIVGRPEKILVASMTESGRQDILAYKIGNDIYVLEFMNDLLFRYEFLREDVVYVPRPHLPPPLPPVVIVQEVPRPTPVELPPTTRPSPLPPASVDQGKTEQETQPQARPVRRPASENARQERRSERNRQATSERNRTGRD